jgi:hypothetical protein
MDFSVLSLPQFPKWTELKTISTLQNSMQAKELKLKI